MTIVLPAICWYFWGMGYMLLPLLRKGTGLATGCESHPFSVHCASGHSNCDLHTAGSALQTPFPGRCSPMGLWWWFQWSAGTENRTRSARCNPSHKCNRFFQCNPCHHTDHSLCDILSRWLLWLQWLWPTLWLMPLSTPWWWLWTQLWSW